MGLNKTIKNIKESKNKFFNIKGKNYINGDLIKNGIHFYFRTYSNKFIGDIYHKNYSLREKLNRDTISFIHNGWHLYYYKDVMYNPRLYHTIFLDDTK